MDRDSLEIAAGTLRLRPTAPSDRAGIIRAGQASTIGGKMPWFPSPFPDHFADEWIARAQSVWDSGDHWVLSILREGDDYLGSIVLSGVGSDEFELAYWVLPEHTGRGVATIAARVAIDWSRMALHPSGYIAKAALDNRASRRVLTKLGFLELGQTGNAIDYRLDAA